MDYYWFIEAIVGIIVGLLLALCTKKAQDVTYGKLDKSGMIVNLVLLAVYALLSPLYIFIGIICRPAYEGFLGVIGGIVSVIAASTAFFCAVGLGASVALRKRGKSKLSFIVQFAGLVGIGLMLLFFCLFYGNLLDTIN
jgi:hypothetical protein